MVQNHLSKCEQLFDYEFFRLYIKVVRETVGMCICLKKKSFDCIIECVILFLKDEYNIRTKMSFIINNS